MITGIKKGNQFICTKSIFTNRKVVKIFKQGEIYASQSDDCITDDMDKERNGWNLDILNDHFKPIAAETIHFDDDVAQERLKEDLQERFEDGLVASKLKNEIDLPPYYDNSKGSLYKISEERGWNAYTFDVVKRLDRGGKKDPLKQEIEKSIGVLQLWLKELTNG